MVTFSVITVSYNDVKGIESTIHSVLGQTYSSLEYIIIDGASSDGTKETAEKYKHIFTDKNIRCRIVSEPDKGIYDAMNKGAALSSGQWLVFLNAGDSFADSNVLLNVSKYAKDSVDVLYGSTIYQYKNLIKQEKPAPINCLTQGMIFCHQSALISATAMKELKYDTQYRTAADYDFFLRCYMGGKKFEEIPVVISRFEIGGESTKGNYKILYEKALVQFNDGALTKEEYEKKVRSLKEEEKPFNRRQQIKKIMPKFIRNAIIKRGYRKKSFKPENNSAI